MLTNQFLKVDFCSDIQTENTGMVLKETIATSHFKTDNTILYPKTEFNRPTQQATAHISS